MHSLFECIIIHHCFGLRLCSELALILFFGAMESGLCLTASYTTEKGFKYPIPKLVGYFSRNQEYKHLNNISKLYYFVAHIDYPFWNLTSPFEVKKCYHKEYDREVLAEDFRYYIEHEDMVRNFSSSKLEEVGFISNNRLFYDISKMVNDCRPVFFYATLFQGIIYLEANKPQNKYERSCNHKESIDHKFAHYVLSDDPKNPPDTDNIINEAEEFFGIFETNINNHRVMCRANAGSILATKGGIDSIKVSDNLDEKTNIEELQKRTFIRLKTTTDSEFKKRVTRKLWIDSLLSPINDFCIGYLLNRYDIVYKIKHYRIDEVFGMIEESDSNKYLGFCDNFLTFIKTAFKNEIEKRKIIIEDIRKIPLIQLTFSSENMDFVNLVKNQDGYIHLPDFYIKEMSKTP